MPEQEIDLTLFVACYNEAENIVATLDAVVAACREVGCTYEIVIIDDASRDRSWKSLKITDQSTRTCRLFSRSIRKMKGWEIILPRLPSWVTAHGTASSAVTTSSRRRPW